MAEEEWRRTPGQGRYAKPEYERRFRLRTLPPDLGEPRKIEDLYVEGTRLRLRRLSTGGGSVFKLTQKVRADEDDPFAVMITNTYLSGDEYESLAGLPGARLSKTRYLVAAGQATVAVDEFHGRLEGLRLAEIEVPARDADLDLPAWVGKEVTEDDRYSGGALAWADEGEIAALLS